jgi:hypothetical protein
MFVVVLRWHKAISWKLGESDAVEGRPYRRPWWTNEAHYALAYSYAKLSGAHSANQALHADELRAGLRH